MTDLAFSIPDEVLDTIADRVAARVLEQLDQQRTGDADAWMTLKQCAAYVGMSEEALRKRRDLPRTRWGGRLLFRRSTVNAFLDSLAES